MGMQGDFLAATSTYITCQDISFSTPTLGTIDFTGIFLWLEEDPSGIIEEQYSGTQISP